LRNRATEIKNQLGESGGVILSPGFIPGFIVPTLCRERKGWATRRIRGTNMLESGKMQEPKYHPSTDRSFTP
jgi:hypothetical protein